MERIAGKLMLSWGWQRRFFAFGAGALAILAQPPFDFFAVYFVSFPILVWLLDGASGEPGAGVVKRLAPAFWTGWWFGFGYFVAGLWWLANALLVEGEGFAWAVPLAVFALPAGLAIFYGLATGLARIFWSEGYGRICMVAVGFGLAEYLRATILTGFPWNAVGYGAMPIPLLMQSSHAVGLLSINTLTVLVAATPALLATRHGLVPGALMAIALICAHVGYGTYVLNRDRATSDAENSITVRIVQPNIDQSEKWDEQRRGEIFQDLIAASRHADDDPEPVPSLIIWPETAIPFILTDNPSALSEISEMLRPGQSLITGAVRVERSTGSVSPRYYNSMYVINSDGEIYDAVDKVHLVPFGEYLPFEDALNDLGFAAIAAMPGGYSAAASRRLASTPDGDKFVPLVCYEGIFPIEWESAETPPNFIVNVTNDAWFGFSPGPFQHARQSQIRAVEAGLPLIRVGNNGVSFVSDANGRIDGGLKFNSVGYMNSTLSRNTMLEMSEKPFLINFWLINVSLVVFGFFSRASFINATN